MTRPVSICVCTFRRPELAGTLASLDAMERALGTALEIVVADNDEAPSAQVLVSEFARRSSIPVRYIHCPAGNISVARNAALDTASGELVAFIDDDELAAPSWLVALLAEHLRSGAEVVLGPVSAIYEASAPAWMRRAAIHDTRPVFRRGRIATGYSCNVLMDRRSPSLEGLRFDPALGRSGGEDTYFFSAARARGARFAFAPEAVLTEPVPAARATFRWLARRRFRMGQTHGRVERDIGGCRPWAAMPVAAAKAVVCVLAAGATAFSTRRRNLWSLRFCLHAGAVHGLAGGDVLKLYGLPAMPGSVEG